MSIDISHELASHDLWDLCKRLPLGSVVDAVRQARDAGFLDVTHAFKINGLGPLCLSAILGYTGLTGNQSGCASLPGLAHRQNA